MSHAFAELERRVALLESIHKLGSPTPSSPRHIASPTEADLAAQRDEARSAFAEADAENCRLADERDEARADAEDYLSELKIQREDYMSVCRVASERLKDLNEARAWATYYRGKFWEDWPRPQAPGDGQEPEWLAEKC